MTVHERNILKATAVGLPDEDDWPEFMLSSAEIRDRGGQLANLFGADHTHALAVTGKLEPPGKDQQRYLVKKDYRKAVSIEIVECKRYAYGLNQDGSAAIWAGGEAGWYNLTPSRTYKPVFAEMSESVELYYFVCDTYTESKMRSQELFQHLANTWPSLEGDAKAAAALVYKHKGFLIQRMKIGKEREQISWGHTSIYQHLRKKYPEAFGVTRTPLPSMVNGKSKSVDAEPEPLPERVTKRRRPEEPTADVVMAEASGSDTPVEKPNRRGRPRKAETQIEDSTSDTIKERPRRGRPPSNLVKTKDSTSVPSSRTTAPTAVPLPVSQSLRRDHAYWKARTVWEFMLKSHASGWDQDDDLTVAGFAQMLVQKFEIDDETEAADYFRTLALPLLSMMQSRRKRSIEWTETGIYKELLTAKVHAARAKKLLRIELKARPVLIEEEEHEEEESGTSNSESEETTPRVLQAKRPKSALRPRGKGPGKSKKPKTYRAAVGGEDDGPSSTTPTKRKASTHSTQLSKRRASQDSDNDDDDEMADESDDLSKDTKALPLRWRKSTSMHGVQEPPLTMPNLTKQPLFSTKPTGPGDTWECGADGCSRKVYGASTPESQDLIRRHIEEHDERRAEQMTIIESESLRVDLPVSFLVQRIREMAANSQMSMTQRQEVDGVAKPGIQVFPDPVRSKY